ncbi:MAG: cupin domain-containing protein [Chloroflexota bacterium]
MIPPTSDTYSWFENLTDLMADIPDERIVSRTLYKDKTVNVVLFGFAAGESLSEHTAAQPAIIHILDGEGTLTLGAVVKEVKGGAWVRMPPNMKHSLLAKTPLKMLLLLSATSA